MRGQSAVETLVSIGFMLFLFVSAMTVVIRTDSEAAEMESFLNNRTSCEALAGGVNAVFASGEGTWVSLSTIHDITVNGGQGEIMVGNVFCLTMAEISNGTHPNFTLTQGQIEITSAGENVVVRNV